LSKLTPPFTNTFIQVRGGEDKEWKIAREKKEKITKEKKFFKSLLILHVHVLICTSIIFIENGQSSLKNSEAEQNKRAIVATTLMSTLTFSTCGSVGASKILSY
jgi:hypothetical protein